MTTTDNVQAVIDNALRSADPTELLPGHIYAWVTPGGGVQKVDLTGDQYSDTPSRKTGTVTLRDTGSFLAYYAKHHDENSEVYADANSLSITAVLDAHTEDGPRFGQHRAHLALRTTKAWQQWLAKDNRLMAQEEFAEHLEDHVGELVSPPAAEMLEIAQSIQGARSAEFASGTRIASGQRQFVYTEQATARAGQKGELTIPETFEIGLTPFEGSAPYKLTARFRYRISSTGVLTLAYKLDRPDDVLKAAFADVLKTVAEGIQEPVMNGSPA